MTGPIERIAIVGTGAMGGMYAAHFARAGFEVELVARGERAERLRAGLTVNAEPLVASVIDIDQVQDAEPADLLIFAVKDRHLADAITDAAAVVGPQTIILSILNGLDSEDRIAARYGNERVLLCVALGMDAEREGHQIRFRQAGRLVFGRALNGLEPDAMVAAVQQALDRAGLAWQTPPDMRQTIWSKFYFNVGINQASALLHAPYGAFQADGDARRLMKALMTEVLQIAVAEGVGLGDQDVARWDAVLASMPAAGWTSMAQDTNAGRETEVETFAGRVVALGERHAIPVPFNQAMLWALRASHPDQA
ncbi:MAG: ketopantoate reductase family protein [Brooklawnia sp.]